MRLAAVVADVMASENGTPMTSKEELQAQHAALQLKLKMWTTSFVKQYGREPTRGDKVRSPAALRHYTA